MNSNKIIDLHNHTSWSDGNNSPEEMIQNAIENGIEIIGISDHFNTDKCDSVQLENLSDYIDMLDHLKNKYKDKIQVLSGLEICMSREWSDLEHLPYDQLNRLDYVLLEYVELFRDSVRFCELDTYIDKISCKIGLAHTDPFELSKNGKLSIDDFIGYLKKHNIFWELNVNPGYCYFRQIKNNYDCELVSGFLKKMRNSGIEMLVGSDTHYLSCYEISSIMEANAMIRNEYKGCIKAKVK